MLGGVVDPMHASTFNVRNLRDPVLHFSQSMKRVNCESTIEQDNLSSAQEVGQHHSTEEVGEQRIIDVAELMEERVLTKRNASERDHDQTQRWSNMMLAFAGVRKQASRNKQQTFTALMHHLTPELLRKSFYELKRQAAKGVDGVTWYEYHETLESRIADLYTCIQNGSYKPKPARRVYIPKADGTLRPLSIQSVEDKIAQQAVVSLLNQIYEVDFMGFSYGFRLGRSQHDALDALTYGISKKKVNWVLDLDIRQFFDTVEHEWLIRMIQHRVQDKRLLKLIVRWIKVGVTDEQGRRCPAQVGVPQGAVISPLLANIYLHYVFDLWSHQWRLRYAKGDVLVVRYADDAVLCFQNKWEANEYLVKLNQRVTRFGLTTHPEKTRLIRFGRYAVHQRIARGEGKPETFDFLGFTHYCTRRQNGEFKVGRKTVRKRMVKQLQAVQYELRRRMHDSPAKTLKWIQAVIRGHMNYYGVPGNCKSVNTFREEIVKRWYKMLKRRSQRSALNWSRFGNWLRRHLITVRVVHPYPEMRFCAKYSK